MAGTGIFGGNSHQTYTSPLDVPPNINITTDPSCHSTFGPRSIRAIKSTIQQHSPTGTGRQAACLATPSSPSRHSTSVSASALDRHHSSVSTRASCASTCQGTQRASARQHSIVITRASALVPRAQALVKALNERQRVSTRSSSTDTRSSSTERQHSCLIGRRVYRCCHCRQ